MYKALRSLLFLFDPEQVHYFSMGALRLLCAVPPFKALLRSRFHPKGGNGKTVFGLKFPNIVGLGAGFDKNARWLTELHTIGFGSVEIGTVTPLAQEGNDRPRLFRLPKDNALINRMGFNNDGVDAVAKRLTAWRNSPSGKSGLIVGGNIGKNKITPNENAWQDYVTCFNKLHGLVDYFVVNVSSPNTPGLRELQERPALKKIMASLQEINRNQVQQRPILLKIAPDLSDEQLEDVAGLAIEIGLDGLVLCNTTISREGLKTDTARLERIGAGGLSGKPAASRSTEVIRIISAKTGGRIPIIASGGIFTAGDAEEKLSAGASLLQVWTGFIYEGPGITRKICNRLGT